MANIVNYNLPNPLLFTVYIQTIFKIYLLISIIFNAFPHEGATIEFQKWSLHGPPIHSNSSELEDHLLVGSCSAMRAQECRIVGALTTRSSVLALFQFRQCARTHSKSWPFKSSSTYPTLESHSCVTSGSHRASPVQIPHALFVNVDLPSIHAHCLTAVPWWLWCVGVCTRRNMWFCKMNSWKILEICIP